MDTKNEKGACKIKSGRKLSLITLKKNGKHYSSSFADKWFLNCVTVVSFEKDLITVLINRKPEILPDFSKYPADAFSN